MHFYLHRAIILGYQSIRNDDAKIVVCGGQENMSQAPHVFFARTGVKLGNKEMVDSMVIDGLTDAFHNVHMGETGSHHQCNGLVFYKYLTSIKHSINLLHM